MDATASTWAASHAATLSATASAWATAATPTATLSAWASSYAATPSGAMTAPAVDMGIFPYLVQLIVVAALMGGLGYLAYRLTKEGRMPGLGLKVGAIRVRDRLVIDAKHSLMVVTVGKRQWLVGSTEQNFTALAELEEADLMNEFEAAVAQATPAPVSGRKWWHTLLGLSVFAVAIAVLSHPALAQGTAFPTNPFAAFDLRDPINTPNMTTSVMLIFLLSILTLLPFVVVMTTSFIRCIVVLGFLRQALGTQSIPPNPVMLGIALFLAMYTMSPVWETIDKTALQPYLARTISQPVMLDRAQLPLKEFMLRQISEPELAFFVRLSRTPMPASPADVPIHVAIPAFMVSELTTAFKIGFVIYVPFIVVDLVVSNVLLALGMSSLPPQMISNSFKLLIFTLANGWHLVLSALVQSFK